MKLLITSTLLIFAACRQAPADLPRLYEVPDTRLVADDSSTVRLSQLHGNVVIYDFFFTDCNGVCPLMTRRMQALAEGFGSEERIRFVSMSVDPANDTPEKLREYAGRVRRNDDRWLFLTGDPDAVVDLSVRGFKLAAGETPPGHGSEPFLHSSRFVLVDSSGWIRGYYDSNSPEELERLESDAHALLRETA